MHESKVYSGNMRPIGHVVPSLKSGGYPMSKSRIFGTDGIRGRANRKPMTPEYALRFGQALGELIRKGTLGYSGERPTVVLGKDTRLSGYMVEMAIASGLCSQGIFVQLIGPMPTPGVAYITRSMRADCGIMVSASHNPYYDNGIKVFGADGFKISDELETMVEHRILNGFEDGELPDGPDIGRARRIDDVIGRYIEHLKSVLPAQQNLEGVKVVLDCANGAGYKVAPTVLQELGANVICRGVSPNGLSINDGVGALHPRGLAAAVIEHEADLGIALDGDADRCVLVDERGVIVDGDAVLALIAIAKKKAGKLPGNHIVSTVMSNLALDESLAMHQISVVRTGVGDRHVVQRMREDGYVFGGEQSGHLVFLDAGTTGDGLMAALTIMSILRSQSEPLSALHSFYRPKPQVLKNVDVSAKPSLETLSKTQKIVSAIELKLAGKGRVLLRYSGTEPKARVMVEGDDRELVVKYAESIAESLQEEINAL